MREPGHYLEQVTVEARADMMTHGYVVALRTSIMGMAWMGSQAGMGGMTSEAHDVVAIAAHLVRVARYPEQVIRWGQRDWQSPEDEVSSTLSALEEALTRVVR